MALPEVVSPERWLEARLPLLAEEKKQTRRRDALNAERRKLPMVRIEKDYVFDGPQGPARLAALFGNSRQLIIQHIMFGPDWEAACPSCTNAVDELSDGLLAHLRARATAFALVSRAPLAKLEAYRAYNYRPEPGLLEGQQTTEMPGHSCFLRDGSQIFHTYSSYGRGNEYTPSLYTLLDLTALGRQEAWEEPKGRAPVLHDAQPSR